LGDIMEHLMKRAVVCLISLLTVAAIGIAFNAAIIEASKHFGYYVGIFCAAAFGIIMFEYVRIMYIVFKSKGEDSIAN